jgi:endonuclease/exonuclease/phosphatase (EEP) superfamily protein YafD
MSGRLKPRGWTVSASMIWFCVAASVLLAGGVIDGRLDSLTFLAPALLLLNTLGLIGLLRWPLLYIRLQLGVALLAQSILVVLVLPESIAMLRRELVPPNAIAATPAVTVLSLNLWHANKDLTQTLNLIAAEAPDIIVLSEASESALDQLNQALGGYPTRITCEATPYCGVAIYSTLPGRKMPGGKPIGSDGPPTDAPAPNLRYAAVELVAPGAASNWIPVVAVHVARGDSVGPHEAQIPALAGVLAGMDGSEATIVAGDFNTPVWSWAMRRLDASLEQERATLNLATWPSGSAAGLAGHLPPLLAIDHIFAGDSWRIISVLRGPDVGSDHYPVIATLQMK